jgi:hypothetical protein
MQRIFNDPSINLYQGDFERPYGITDEFDCENVSQQNAGHRFEDDF